MKMNLEANLAKFSNINWHDSELLEFSVIKGEDQKGYNLRLAIRPVQSSETSEQKYTLIFKECRFTVANLDLIFMKASLGSIDDAICYQNFNDIKEQEKIRLKNQYSPYRNDILVGGLCFYFELLPSGGEIIIFADDLEVINDH